MRAHWFKLHLIALGVVGCVAEAPDPVSGVAKGSLSVLDPPDVGMDPEDLSDPVARVQMDAGRENQLQVSYYYETSRSSQTGLHVRTVCGGDSDSGILVRGRGLARFNDDSSAAGGNGRGSYVAFSAPTPAVEETFTVTVFSMKRATADCGLEESVDGGATWTLIHNDHFGGALVDVGPLREGDFLEVQATSSAGDDVSGGPNHHATQLLLFDPQDETTPVLYSNGGGYRTFNPRIEIPDDSRTTGRNWVLVGKRNRSTDSNLGVEVRVDLVHGPLDTDYTTTALGTWRFLKPGRYYAWIYAKTTAPIGTTEGYSNPADVTWAECPSDNRGRLDGNAFSIHLDRWVTSQPSGPQLVKSRQIRFAQMGARAGEFNAFLLPFEVPTATWYRMRTSDADSTVAFFGSFRVYRNPDASELTAVTWNALYDDGHNHENKILNAANLLATRGIIDRSSRSISEPADQAPFQWDADIVGIQELPDEESGVDDPFYYADVFQGEARRVGNTDWTYVWGDDEEYLWWDDGSAPLFVSSPFYPNRNAVGIYFGTAAMSAAGCEGTLPTAHCEIDASFPGQTWYSTVGHISVHRFDHGADRPITIVNLHFTDDDDYEARKEQIDYLIDILQDLLAAEPTAFNPSGDTSPQHYQNRILLMGDFNMKSHHCGEHYWLMRKLRDAFGYAVDTSMYVGDNDGHDSAGDFSDWVPFDDYPEDARYPWWVTTYRGKDADGLRRTERYDGIMLVGKGWAYDDPIVDYEVMNDRSESTPLRPDGRAVEMWAMSDLVTDWLDASGLSFGYRPSYRLSFPPGGAPSGSFTPGEPALDSDHVPVRARLRVFLR